jgi:hypothetical protein
MGPVIGIECSLNVLATLPSYLYNLTRGIPATIDQTCTDVVLPLLLTLVGFLAICGIYALNNRNVKLATSNQDKVKHIASQQLRQT